MTTISIPFTTKSDWLKAREPNINSTDVAALFDCSPYMTRFELWHRKHDKTSVELEDNSRMFWGRRLQQAIAEGIAEKENWFVTPWTDYIYDSELRIGSSFDFQGFQHLTPLDIFILEIKNVDSLQFRDGWIVDGDSIEAPPHIELQVQMQMLVSGLKTAYIGALVGGNDVKLIKRERNETIIQAIRDAVKEFWRTVDANEEPKPDFSRDADFVAKLYNHAEPGRVIDATDSMALLSKRYAKGARIEKLGKKVKDAAKAELLTLIGEAEQVKGVDFTINAGLVGPVQIEAYERAGYRNFKISWKKEKK